MSYLNVNKLIPIVLTASGVISAADDWDRHVVNFDALIWKVEANIGVTGSSSGNNDFVVERTPSGGSAGDLWTVASGIGRIAYNAAAKYLGWDWEHAGWTGYASGQTYPPTGARLSAGDTLYLNVNAVAGAGSPADLKVTLWVYPLAD